MHPASGAGRIKRDFSTDGALVEMKRTSRTHQVKSDDIRALLKQAIEVGKRPFYVIEFAESPDMRPIYLVGAVTYTPEMYLP